MTPGHDSQREFDCDDYGHRVSPQHSRREAPDFERRNGLHIQAEPSVERIQHTDVSDLPGNLNEPVEKHSAMASILLINESRGS